MRQNDWATATLRLIPPFAVAFTPLLIYRPATSTMLPKASLLFVLAGISVGLLIIALGVRRRLELPSSTALIPTVILAVALVIAAVVAPISHTAWLGPPMRSAGLAAYLACLLLLVITVQFGTDASRRWLITGGLIAALGTALLGAAQLSPVDLGPWSPRGQSPVALLGNTNFSSALLGMSVPLAVWGGLYSGWPQRIRVAVLALGALAFAVALLSRSVQGPVVAVAGCLPLLGAMVLERGRNTKQILLAGGVATASATVMFIGGLATGRGLFGWVADLVSLGPRLWYWEAGLAMFRENPFFGVGLGMYPWQYTVYRSADSVRDLPEGIVADSPHSVPIGMLAEGGLVLAAAYLLFVAATATYLVLGLRSRTGDQRMLLAALGGAWLGYQTQSLISIEVPALMVWNYALAGAIIALGASPQSRLLRLPGHQRATKRPSRSVPVVTVGVLIGGLLLFVGLLPLRADVAYAEGRFWLDEFDDPLPAVHHLEESVRLLPSDSRAWSRLGVAYGRSGDIESSLEAMSEAVNRNAFDRSALGLAAQTHTEFGDVHEAARLWDLVVRADPTRPQALTAAARFFADQGDSEKAASLFETALTVEPESADIWDSLADVYRQSDRHVDAHHASAAAERFR